MKTAYSIRDLEKLSGIKAHTIRIWEKRYGLIEPQRSNTNIRSYCDADLKRILSVAILNRNGYKISKIVSLSKQETDQLIYELNSCKQHQDVHIENLILSMVELDTKKFERQIQHSIDQVGFESTILEIIYPFLNRVGVMWQVGSINIGQEHFISNLIRQKILNEIEQTVPQVIEHPKSFILFLPENEFHELALLFMHYLVKSSGHSVIYLGQSTPLQNVIDVSGKIKPTHLLTYFTAPITYEAFKEYIKNLSSAFKYCQILIAGQPIGEYIDKYPKNVLRIVSPQEMKSYLKLL